jgi:hypothetical protein
MALALFIYLLALVSWLGGMIFFILTTATMFGAFPQAEAARVLAPLFPRYYLLGYIAGFIASVLAIYLTVAYAPKLWWGFASAALAIALALTFYSGVFVFPRVEAIRTVTEEPNPDPARKGEFDRLHQLSVRLNGVVIVLNLIALASTATAVTRHA